MSGHEIELTIERIVLHDLPAVPRQRLVSAIEDALLRLLAADGLPADLAAESIGLPAASIEVMPGASIETMAGQIARSIMTSLRPGMEGVPPGAVPRGAQLSSQAYPSETTQGR